MLTSAQFKTEYWLRKLLPKFGLRIRSANYDRKSSVQIVETDFCQVSILSDGKITAWCKGHRPTPVLSRVMDLKPHLAAWGWTPNA